MKADYDDIVIDCGGRDTASLRAALTISDVFVVPFQPKSFDIWTVSRVSELAEEACCINPYLQVYSFINCGGARGNDNEEAQNILKQVDGISLIPVSVGLRKAFSTRQPKGWGW